LFNLFLNTYLFDIQLFKIMRSVFSKNLSFLLEKNNRNNSYMAKLSGLSRSTIGNYSSGNGGSPSVDFLLLISKEFEISCDDLLKVDIEQGLKGSEDNPIHIPVPGATNNSIALDYQFQLINEKLHELDCFKKAVQLKLDVDKELNEVLANLEKKKKQG
jgi:transcriptional regulator with XRE-family HTH domain